MNRIVIVDDVAANGRLLKGYIGGLPNIAAQTFTSALDALECCLAEPPDLVLLDYLMPEMDGIEFLRRLRAIDPLRDVPVVMITGEESRATLYKALNSGATDFLRKPVDRVELIARARNMLELRDRQRALIEANAQLLTLATTDPLTGLKNRRAFLEDAEDELRRSRRFGRPFSVAVLDVDHFKTVNDTHGHDVGDAILRSLARVLADDLRAVDTAGRLGGEEFALLFPEIPLEGAVAACSRLLARVREMTVSLPAGELSVTASIGLTAGCPEDSGLDTTLKRADLALYAAKRRGRDRLETSHSLDTERAA